MKNIFWFLVIVALLYLGFTQFSQKKVEEKSAISAYERAGVADLAGDGIGLGKAVADLHNEAGSLEKGLQETLTQSIPEKIESWFISFFNKHVANSDENLFDEESKNYLDEKKETTE